MLAPKIIDPIIRQAAPAVVLSVIELRARLQHRLIKTNELPDAFKPEDRRNMAAIATSAYLMGLALSCLKDAVADQAQLDQLFKQVCGDVPSQSAANGGPCSLVDCLAAVCG